MKLLTAASLLVNLVLTVALGVQARNVNSKVLAATEEVSASDIAKCDDAVKTVIQVGYLGGCMTAIAEAKHLEKGDPLIPLYMDYCMQGAEAISRQVEAK